MIIKELIGIYKIEKVKNTNQNMSNGKMTKMKSITVHF